MGRHGSTRIGGGDSRPAALLVGASCTFLLSVAGVLLLKFRGGAAAVKPRLINVAQVEKSLSSCGLPLRDWAPDTHLAPCCGVALMHCQCMHYVSALHSIPLRPSRLHTSRYTSISDPPQTEAKI
eukprot:scaffold75229_cov31-Tisochrysis_lutea.AAC.3